jgi:NADH-quinone oxidoreductase subunit N
MCIGNLGALRQHDVKRLLAYSSIAHAGYILVAFTGMEANAVSGVMFYTAAYAAMNVGAFLVLTQLSGFSERVRSLEDFTGIALKRPGLSALLGFFLLSLIGIPFTGGFFGKFYVFAGAVHNGHVWLAIIGLLNSGVACFYYLRLLAAMYSRPLTDSVSYIPVRKVTVPAALALAATVLATLGLGILPNKLVHLVERAAPVTAAVTTPSVQ